MSTRVSTPRVRSHALPLVVVASVLGLLAGCGVGGSGEPTAPSAAASPTTVSLVRPDGRWVLPAAWASPDVADLREAAASSEEPAARLILTEIDSGLARAAAITMSGPYTVVAILRFQPHVAVEDAARSGLSEAQAVGPVQDAQRRSESVSAGEALVQSWVRTTSSVASVNEQYLLSTGDGVLSLTVAYPRSDATDMQPLVEALVDGIHLDQ